MKSCLRKKIAGVIRHCSTRPSFRRQAEVIVWDLSGEAQLTRFHEPLPMNQTSPISSMYMQTNVWLWCVGLGGSGVARGRPGKASTERACSTGRLSMKKVKRRDLALPGSIHQVFLFSPSLPGSSLAVRSKAIVVGHSFPEFGHLLGAEFLGCRGPLVASGRPNARSSRRSWRMSLQRMTRTLGSLFPMVNFHPRKLVVT